ncbi:MAG: hypothetical protein KGP28_02825 [Bdellovibrionales bacterium]|nr:hypothetical protein [Bdellovibrionales bacterium]
MAKHTEMTDDLDLIDEGNLETAVQKGPIPSIAPLVGSLDRVVQKYSHCGVCGGRLHFNYASDFSRNLTEEKASCPECGLDSRQSLHRLQ